MSDEPEEEYSVRLDVFEGPLDLLLYLIKKDEVDIYDIPIVKITEQYNAYLNVMRMLDLNIAGEFLVMSATLMMIKSRMLLPQEERPDFEDEDEDDPRFDLVRQLVEYKKFKDAAGFLEDQEEDQHNVFWRESEEVDLGVDPTNALKDVGIFDLLASFTEILKRVDKEELREIFIERYTVAEQIDKIIDKINSGERISLMGMFQDMHSRQEMVCTFLAILELIRLKHIRAVQEEGPFSDILVVPAETEEDIITTI